MSIAWQYIYKYHHRRPIQHNITLLIKYNLHLKKKKSKDIQNQEIRPSGPEQVTCRDQSVKNANALLRDCEATA